MSLQRRGLKMDAKEGDGMAGATVESIGLLAAGMLLLGLSLSKRAGLHRLSLLAWPLVGLGFFLMAGRTET